MRIRTVSLAIPLLLCCTEVDSCVETDIIEDPGFQFWCGDTLCEWELLAGDIERVPTWHTNDSAVELIGAPVILRQDVDRGANGCILIELIADVEPGADVTIVLDQDGQGGTDWTAVIDRTGFRSMQWEVDVDLDVGGSVSLRKANPGRAVITQLRVSRRCGESSLD